MRAAVIIFPGSNCDRDMVVALRESGANVSIVNEAKEIVLKDIS